MDFHSGLSLHTFSPIRSSSLNGRLSITAISFSVVKSNIFTIFLSLRSESRVKLLSTSTKETCFVLLFRIKNWIEHGSFKEHFLFTVCCSSIGFPSYVKSPLYSNACFTTTYYDIIYHRIRCKGYGKLHHWSFYINIYKNLSFCDCITSPIH